jgi:hypothetical protein
MDLQEETYFDMLSKHRSKLADAIEDPALYGIKDSVVEKYSDQAHFIYELLQNADDAGATYARFILRSNDLIFAHNGERFFTISNPETEKEDGKLKRLGDINAITSIGNTNKQENKIGKFGVGFKAVFQYTATPHIYDQNIHFKIERFIVPVKLDTDHPARKPTETLFVFPFDHTERDPQKAYTDISENFLSLVYPVLFLTKLKEIKVFFECSARNISYKKSVEKDFQFADTNVKCLHMIFTQNNDDDKNEQFEDRLWLFTKNYDKDRSYSVGFFIDADNRLRPVEFNAFCFFPTKEETSLKFIIHAPFLLNDSREGIKAWELHNKNMIELLAQLSAESLCYFKKIECECGIKLINDSIFDIIPYDESKFTDIKDKRKISFKPFYSAIQNAFLSEELLPSSEGYTSVQNAYWAEYSQITGIFSNEQLANLFGKKDAKWVFTSFSRAEVQRTNKLLFAYIDTIIHVWINESDIINGFSYKNGTKVNGITASFIEMQPIDWLHKFYKWASETKSRMELVKTKPIFLNQERKAVPAFEKYGEIERLVLFLPVEDTEGYETLYQDLLCNEETIDFVNNLGITRPSLEHEIYNKILPLYKDGPVVNTKQHFNKFFQYYKELPQLKADSFISLIKEYKFVLYRSSDDEKLYRGKANDLYFPYEPLQKWFLPKQNIKFVQLHDYIQLVGDSNRKELIIFLSSLGVKNEPKVLARKLNDQEGIATGVKEYSTDGHIWIDRYIDGCKEIINLLIERQDSELSIILWNQMLSLVKNNSFRNAMYGTYEYFYYNRRSCSFESSELHRLRSKPWILNNDGKLCSANEITQNHLSSQYDTQSAEALELIRFLEIQDEPIIEDKNDSIDDILDKLSDLSEEQMRKIYDYLAPRVEEYNPTEANNDEWPTEDIPTDIDRFTESTIKSFCDAKYVEFADITQTRSERISGGGDRANTEYRYGGFCQKCRNVKGHWVLSEMFLDLNPRKELEQMYLSLCPNCAAEYRQLRVNNPPVMAAFKKALINSQYGDYEVKLTDNIDIYFTQKHLAEIKIILEKMEENNDASFINKSTMA